MLRELPPRARRIQINNLRPIMLHGTTSACAENTSDRLVMRWSMRNYLRVRGEYLPLPYRIRLTMELPPRARRIRLGGRLLDRQIGTTSACAENTRIGNIFDPRSRNYLRVRGEYAWGEGFWIARSELPPRARRIHHAHKILTQHRRTTSACAENTSTCPQRILGRRNYLRVRGEYVASNPGSSSPVELPPRARRILLTGFSTKPAKGTTSACAENTVENQSPTIRNWNYLRVRGEYPS